MSKLAKQGGNFGNVMSGFSYQWFFPLQWCICHLCTPPE